MIMRRSRVVLLAALAAVATSCSGHAMSQAKAGFPSAAMIRGASAATVTADPVPPDPRIGAVFVGGNAMHSCTGSVLHTATGDLVLTAAHCMADGSNNWFVPAFSESAEPQDFWHIDQIYLDPRWIATQNPLADFAIIRVSDAGRGSLESVVGGGFTLGSTPDVGTDVAVTGYATGIGGGPIGCVGRLTTRESGYPSLRCGGLVDGTSGAPWLAGTTVVGVTGGLQGGGCQENVSYAPPFDVAILQLVARAEAGGSGDKVPPSYVDGC
jgi:hypothetical protein